MKFRVKWKFGRFFTNVRNGHCFSQNENSRCSSKTTRKIERKVAKSRNEFSRTVLDRIERSRENSFRADRGKHHLNLRVDLPVFSQDFMLYCDDANARAHGNSCCLYRALKIEDQLIRAAMPKVSSYTQNRIESLHGQNLHPAEIFKLLKKEELVVSFATVTRIIKKLKLTGPRTRARVPEGPES